jgi:hypothetical protein
MIRRVSAPHGVLHHTGRDGASREFSNNGVGSPDIPAKAAADYKDKMADAMVDAAVLFIEA